MPNSRMIVLTALAAASFAGGVFAQEPAGQVLWSMGKVERVGPDGAATPLAKGEGVFEGDVIRSAAGSHAQILMRDEALIAVRPESSLRLETYAYQGREDGTERAVVELIKGGMRSITGAVGRTNKDSYQLRTRMILIGIRGTDHETFASEAGTYNRVTVGGTYLQGPDGRLDLAPGEVGFASLTPGTAPLRLDRTPEVMHLSMTANGNTGPQLRQASPSDGRRLEKGLPHARLPESMPVLPAQALGENTGKGWGKGGRCEGSCSDPVKNQGRGNGRGRP